MDDFVDPTLLELDRFAIGQPVPRSEDPVLVCGKGQFTDDVSLPGQAYAVMVRSGHAHGVIRGIDTAAARGMPGVLGVYAAADLENAGIGTLQPRQVMNNRDGTPMLSPVRYALATDKVRYVGEAIAAVVAETLAEAKDAAEAVLVDIEPLPAATTASAAAAPGARWGAAHSHGGGYRAHRPRRPTGRHPDPGARCGEGLRGRVTPARPGGPR